MFFKNDTISEKEQNFIRVSKASVEVLTDILYGFANTSAYPITKSRNECDITYLYGELRRQGLDNIFLHVGDGAEIIGHVRELL